MDKISCEHRESKGLICQKCGVEFTGITYVILGHEIPQKLCRACSDEIITQEKEAEKTKRQADITAQRRRWRESCGIEPRYMSEDFSTFDPKRPGNISEIHRICVNYADQFPVDYDSYRRRTRKAYPSLLLFSTGVWGNGKTHLVSSIAHRILDRWNGENIVCPVRFICETKIYELIQQTYSYSYDERSKKFSEQEIINQLASVKLLIIDDIGKVQRRDMDFVRRIMYDIINKRYDALLPVVFTTNKDTEGLRDYLGNAEEEASLDRIIGMTGGEMWQVKGKSYRRDKKA
jgi:DNA replication protein DnaC